MPVQHLTPASVTSMSATGLRPICERLLATLERARGDRDRERLSTRAALRHAVTAYVNALRSEGISPPWVLESVLAFARGVRTGRSPARSYDPVEADVVRWSLAALRWPPMRSTADVEVLAPRPPRPDTAS
jgi:hypothetical protein